MMKPLHNIHLKLLALLSAVILWFVVITVENTIYPFPEQIEVEIVNLEPNVSIASNIPEVKLFLRVDKEELKSLTANDFEVFIDLKGTEAGSKTVKIQATTTKPEARILQVQPSEIELKISPTSEKEVEVKINTVGDPFEGYLIEDLAAENETVKITGAQSIIDTIDHVNAELLLDGTEKKDLNQTVMLAFDPNDNIPEGLVQVVPEQMVVNATITSELKQKEVSVSAGFNDDSDRVAWESNITLDPERVIIQGSEEALSAIESLETNPFELSTLNRAGSVEASLSLPEGVSTATPNQKIIITLIEEVITKEEPEAPKGDESPISETDPDEDDRPAAPSNEPTI